MRVVLDTNILISALITRGTPPDIVYQAWRKKRFTLISSERQLDELRRVSHRPQLKPYLKPAEVGRLVNGLRRQAVILTHIPSLDVSKDPNDNPILSTAVAGSADVLVTGDKSDLLVLGKVASTRIVTARQLVDELAV